MNENEQNQHKIHINVGRHTLVLGLLIMAGAALVWRAWDLQLNHKEFLQSQGNARHMRVVTTTALRGKILDRNGASLAVSSPVDSLWVNPKAVNTKHAKWPDVLKIVGLGRKRTERLLKARRSREFVYLRRHIDPQVGQRIDALEVPGVHLQREYRRYYPLGEVVAHVVGFTNLDDMGQEGIELGFDEKLRGKDGSKRVLRDRMGRVVEDIERLSAPKPGGDLTLSIDRRVQYMAYVALLRAVNTHKARAGSAVVLDAVTGEVLAMVNQPSYNPNNRADRVSARYRNRAVTDVFEPGSAIKPFAIASALERGVVTPDSMVDTRPGRMNVGKHVVQDVRNYGVISVAKIIQKSSNVGASKLALSIEPMNLWQTFQRVGIGESTGSGFPGESVGVLKHYRNWSEIERVTQAFGYGLSVTALQLAQAYTAIAADGLMKPVSFQRLHEPLPSTRMMTKGVARELAKMLESVVQEGGTGQLAAVEGYRVGGKTGTVKKSTLGGYAEDRYLALFAGIAPMSAPRLVTVVVIDEPGAGKYYGGQVAAPVFSEIVTGALRVLGVAPDGVGVTSQRIAASSRQPQETRVKDRNLKRMMPTPTYARNVVEVTQALSGGAQ